MAKKNQVYIDVIIDDKGTTKRVAVNAKKLGAELEKAGVGSDRAAKGTDKLSKSTKDLDRNMRGTAKMSSNQSKNFSKMQQGMGGLVGAYATLAAQVFAVTAAFQFLQVASDFRNLISGQEALGAVTGVAYKSITASIIEATDAQIQYGEAARAAAIGTAAGVTSSQLVELATAAKNASFALGRDLTDSFNRLVRGVTKAEPELLDELGIILRLENATEKYARSIGKARTELNAFERTQAVTNDVLEQAERKFGAIEALMDPNAAALNQFTKSFDDLIKAFQIGVIDVLTPILKFLTDNTTALVATLSLISLPILKAILPSMRDWRDESRLVAKESKAAADSYIKDMDRQTEALLGAQVTRKREADRAAKQATKDIKKRGTSAPAGGGLSYLMGDDKGSKGGASRILSNARKQINEHGAITTGTLEGYNEKQLQNLEKSYDKRIAAADTTSKKITGAFARGDARIKRGWAGLGVAWNSVMAGMAKAAAAAAIAINAVFAITAIIGAITLLVSGFKSLLKWLGLVDEEMLRQEKTIEGLSEKYKTLNEEVLRARQAREELLSGTAVSSNVGQVLQSIDVPNFLKDVNILRSLDSNADGYEEFSERVRETAKELGKIDPRFKTLGNTIKKGDAITQKQASAYEVAANELINLGQQLDSLPEKYTAFDKSVTALTKSLVKSTPLQDTLKQSEALKTQLRASLENVRTRTALQGKAIREQHALRKKQRDLDKEAFGDDEQGLKDFNKLTFKAQQMRRRSITGTASRSRNVVGLRDDKTIELMEESFKGSREQSIELSRELGTQSKFHGIILGFEKDRVAAQDKLNTLSAKATATLSQGLTIEGKLGNLNQEKLANEQKLQKARQVTRDARLAEELLIEKGGATDQELEDQRALVAVALEKEKITERQYQIQQLNILNKQKELEMEKRLLETKKEIIRLEGAITSDRIAQEEKNIGLGTSGFQSSTQRRQTELNILTQEKILAAKRAEVAQEVFTEEKNKLERAALDRMTGGKTDKATESQKAAAALEAENLAAASPQQQALDQAKNDQAQADLNFRRVKDIQKVLANTNNLKIEGLKLDAETVAFGRENKVFAELYRAEREAGIIPEKINVELLRQQAKTMNDLAVLAEARQGIFDKIESSMQGAFTAIIDGSKNAKQAFADMARSILQHLAKVLAEMMVARILSTSLFQSFGFETGGITPPKKEYAKGGYTSPRMDYSRGGVARGPQSGYNAVLHGNEAVVPLPDNRHIPVEMTGGGGQQNNVTVNVSMDGQGQAQTSSQSNGPQAERVGTLIARAVQDELQNQKRSGGILSPYGAA